MSPLKRSALLLLALSGGAQAADCTAAQQRAADDPFQFTLYQRDGLSPAQQNRLDELLVQERLALQQLAAQEQRNRTALAAAVAAGADHESLRALAQREGSYLTDMILLQAAVQRRLAALLRQGSAAAPIRA